MNRDLARHVANIALASVNRLKAADYALEKNCSGDEFAEYTAAIGKVEACVEREILSKLYAAHPDLQSEIAARIAKYGERI